MVKKCNHKEADKVKPGKGTMEVMDCKVCHKLIIKGRMPPKKNGCFGQVKVAPYSSWTRPKTNREEVYAR